MSAQGSGNRQMNSGVMRDSTCPSKASLLSFYPTYFHQSQIIQTEQTKVKKEHKCQVKVLGREWS